MAHDVFISYSHKDKVAADAVCSILEKNQIRCWMAPRDITPGAPFAEAIIDGIKGSKVFILVYSSNSNQSAQVIKEVDRAVHHGLAIIPLRLEDVPMTKQLEYYVSDVHWLDALTPPLERHINKLCSVVQMLLKMDEADKDEIREAIREGIDEKAEPGRHSRRILTKRILIPAAVLILTAVVAGTVLLFKKQADKRWAREVALPEIERMIDENDVYRNLTEPYYLAERAEAILGNDPRLAELFSKISLQVDVITDPPGANVFIKDYSKPDDEWKFLGVSPLKKVRVPVGIFRWKLEKEGYVTVPGAASSWRMLGSEGKQGQVGPNPFLRKMDRIDSIPARMVRVPATEANMGRVNDFFIGMYEVTNSEYKAFIDAGGYRESEYWKHTFVKEGKELTWEEAVREFVDQSGQPGPSTWIGGDFASGQGDYPVSGVSWYEAAAYAEYSGLSLPTTAHWNVARGAFTPMIQVYQLGGFALLAPFSNFGGSGPVAVGSLPGITPYGAYDMAGNVREWCWNITPAGRVIRGGAWEDNTYEFVNQRQAPEMDRSRRNGFRLAYYPEFDSIPQELFAAVTPPEQPDPSKIKPVNDEIFRIYLELFSYDPAELNSQIEYHAESPGGWIREKVSFDAAYGGERITAYLFLPQNVPPPYQTVIYFPGSAATRMTSSDQLEEYYEFPMFLSYFVRNGRAVLWPVYKGTFERGKPELAAIHGGNESHAFTEFMVQVIKDLRRSIDYLHTRADIDTGKLAFYGMSWGGWLGTIIPAVEDRLALNLLVAGGLNAVGRPEVNAINYVTRVTIPTLMLNGMYDRLIDQEIKPMPVMLGTAPDHKRLILYETDHIPPRTEYIKETLAWLDKYFGPVR
ncbi:MAG: SUMF1/EgtB/PvdO family nonheme iron enzyme [Bacteroidales bacterium]|nr:SUMF1/EgtB/PvdO family nonheme iron enzyme [Bacteroidales bacterium]